MFCNVVKLVWKPDILSYSTIRNNDSRMSYEYQDVSKYMAINSFPMLWSVFKPTWHKCTVETDGNQWALCVYISHNIKLFPCILLICFFFNLTFWVSSWWRHQMEIFSALLAICAGNSPAPVKSPHKGQWRGTLMFSLICVWINGWVNNREAGDLRRHRAHYDVTVMIHIRDPNLVVIVLVGNLAPHGARPSVGKAPLANYMLFIMHIWPSTIMNSLG